MTPRLAALCLAGALLGACTRAAPAPAAPALSVRFLLVNDVYVADTMSDGSGGLARVGALRAQIADEGPVLFVLAGDVLSPSLLSKYYNGRQMVEAFNAAGLDYATFGNHEFELRRDTLVARIAESRFTWLSANCTEADGRPFPGVPAWDTVTVAGTRVGIFGLTLTGDYRSYVRCTDPVRAARTAMDTLRALGAEVIVALTHQPVSDDRALLEREPALALVLGGHEHDAHTVALGERHLLKADANARTAQLVALRATRGGWRQADSLVPITRELPADPAIVELASAWQDSLRARLGPERVIGRTDGPIDARDAVSRNEESELGRLVTDAMRAGTGADVAILNSGTLRLDDVIPPGPISNYRIESIFLFADETRIVRFPLTGARLRAVLEHGVSESSVGTGAFLQASGVRFTYDTTRPSGSRIIDGPTRPDGTPIADDVTVQVAFGVYPACEGGDGYTVPEAADACRAWERAPRAAELVVRFIEDSLGGRVAPRPTGRMIAH